MFELLLVPALAGVAFAFDYLPPLSDLIGGQDDSANIDEDPMPVDSSLFEGDAPDNLSAIGGPDDQITDDPTEDQSVLTTASHISGMPSVLADFSAEEDVLSVVFLDEVPADTSVEFLHDADAEELHAVVDGQNIATLKGLTAEDLPFIRTSVTMTPEALDQAA